MHIPAILLFFPAFLLNCVSGLDLKFIINGNYPPLPIPINQPVMNDRIGLEILSNLAVIHSPSQMQKFPLESVPSETSSLNYSSTDELLSLNQTHSDLPEFLCIGEHGSPHTPLSFPNPLLFSSSKKKTMTDFIKAIKNREDIKKVRNIAGKLINKRVKDGRRVAAYKKDVKYIISECIKERILNAEDCIYLNLDSKHKITLEREFLILTFLEKQNLSNIRSFRWSLYKDFTEDPEILRIASEHNINIDKKVSAKHFDKIIKDGIQNQDDRFITYGDFIQKCRNTSYIPAPDPQKLQNTFLNIFANSPLCGFKTS